MLQEARARLYRRRRRASQHAHRLNQEEMLRSGSDHDLELKSISCEPTTEQELEQDEEEEDDDEEEEEEDEQDEDEEEELAPESSMEEEKNDFAHHRKDWEFTFKHGNRTFDLITSLSPMVYTHCTPSCLPEDADLVPSLQMFSIKIAKIKHLQWPLHVYGTVAARDYVDHKRNIIFFRPRSESQTITKNDPYLHLTGPHRGLLSVEPVHIEIRLMLKEGQSWPEDRELVTQAFRYNNPSNCNYFFSHLTNYLCKIEMCFEQLVRSRQATVLAVRVMQGSPFKYGGQVLCCASPYDDDTSKMIVLFDSKYGNTSLYNNGTMSMDPDGYLDLSRRVVSVQGRLKIFIHTYSRSGAVLATGRVSFRAKDCQTSQARCVLHNRHKGTDSAVKITVAWSRFARKISNIEMDCFTNL
ncbi:uncharacterized protein [Lolium perenne]|uniref:uncharacterized protein n=1 Tax=Lolium perenne TaxID=4522 RepID=UPI0021F53F67|nr:uncharacterized protein LOC127331301 [Lolium perenne]